MIPSVIAEQVRARHQRLPPHHLPHHQPVLRGLPRPPPGQERRRSSAAPSSPSSCRSCRPAGGTAFFPEVLPAGFQPYRHQQQAFERLDTRAGLNTLVATGTGSGKTECFLYPILDHCFRNRGRKGIKAIVIYPMNALATDQAKRFAEAIYGNPELRGYVTAGLYLGGQELEASAGDDREPGDHGPERDAGRRRRTSCSPTTRCSTTCWCAPRDLPLWRQNEPETLRYLVVDELHTFDGAQGADLACLIRRVKERVKTPRGQLICVGTSATLGDGSRATAPGIGRVRHARVRRAVRRGQPDRRIGPDAGRVSEGLPGQVRPDPGPRTQAGTRPAAVRDAGGLRPRTAPAVAGDGDRRIGRAATGASALGLSLKSHAFFRNLLTILEGKAQADGEAAGRDRKADPQLRPPGPGLPGAAAGQLREPGFRGAGAGSEQAGSAGAGALPALAAGVAAHGEPGGAGAGAGVRRRPEAGTASAQPAGDSLPRVRAHRVGAAR